MSLHREWTAHQLIAVTVEDLCGPCSTTASCKVFTCTCFRVSVDRQLPSALLVA